MIQQQHNGDSQDFGEATLDWDVERLVKDLEGFEKRLLTLAEKRNLQAILLGLSASQAQDRMKVAKKTRSLDGYFNKIRRIVELFLDLESSTLKTSHDVVNALASYRKGQELTPPKPEFDLLGRDSDRQKLNELSQKHKLVLLKAAAGIGKSTLARHFLETQFTKVIRLEMGLESGNVTPAEEKVSQILRKEFDEEPSRDFQTNLEILREKLSDKSRPIGVLIDNLEPALDANFRFLEKLRGYEDLLRILGDRDVCSFTLITSRLWLNVQRVKVHPYSLQGLDIGAWREYFHDCENGATSEALEQMCVAYNGNAKVMDILHGAITNRFDGNIAAYWNRYKDALLADAELETLISVEMDWLRDNQPDAYKLLCRMGCYRYQDVKTVPFEGLICLLWDVPESQKIGVVDYLSKSSLIEVKGEYSLHPAVRESAKLELLSSDLDWNMANHKAASFWLTSFSKIVSFNDAIRVFESLEHYFCIESWEEAFLIIRTSYRELGFVRTYGYSELLIEKMNRIAGKLSPTKDVYIRVDLGISLYYLSRYREAIAYLDIDKDIIKTNFYLDNGVCVLRWLCACYLDMGNLSLALKHGNIGISLTQKVKEPQDMEIHLLNLTGSAHSNLCNYEAALENHYLALEKAINQNNKRQIGYSSAYIAYCKFFKADFFQDFQGDESSIALLEKAINIFQEVDDISSEVIARCFIARLYLQLGKILLAEESYNYANQTNKELARKTSFLSPYLQNILLNTSAKLNFVGNNFVDAIDLYKKSIKLCEEMETKFFLAESYFQLGLTYQAMGEHDQSETYKAKALELFEQMEAPKQIERVNQAFEQGAKQ